MQIQRVPAPWWRVLAVCCGVVLTFVGLSGCREDDAGPPLTTTYQAIVMTNGQLFFGKLQQAGSRFPVLTDVHIIQTQTNPETKQVSNVLVKRGKEAHAPDRMVLNAQQILIIEPVTPGSQIEKLLQESTAK